MASESASASIAHRLGHISPRTLTAVRQGLRNWATKHDVIVTHTMLDEMVGEIVLAWAGAADAWT